MNMMKAIETQAAPFQIGQGFANRNGREWIVAIAPVDTQGGLIRRQCLVIGGPSPMAEIAWNITTVCETGHISARDEHTVARLIEQAPIPDCLAPAKLLADAIDKREAARAMQRQREADTAAAREVAKAELERYRPAWAQAAIVAELHHDDSDSMTDYHNHKTSRVVVLAWSKHTRDLFPELRKAAALFPETAELADAPEKAEHREKYSMGAGFYLKNGWRDSSGWCVKKTRADWLDRAGLEFTDHAKGLAAPTAEPATLPPTASASNAAGLFRISQHVHTKKGFAMWICELVERVEREDYERFLAAAKALGGWYSRAWAGSPAGFAFKSEAAALQFVGADAPPPTGGIDAPAAEPRPAPTASAPVNVAAKLRDMADAMQAAIDDKFRDRRSNTPKQQRQAAEARQDGADLERAQRIMRALADCHDAGTVPACLARVTTKAAILELSKEGIDRRNAGYYDAGFPTGKPYDWAAIRKPDMAEKAAAAWGLLDTAEADARREAEALRQKIEGLKFARIPGYFPTPADLAARMIREADLLPGARVVEPSAGSGAIADALREAGHRVECVERHNTLCKILADKGHSVIAGDFLEISPAGLYDAAIMNPPFEGGQDLQHVRHAFDWIKAGGSLVAIMGAGVTFRQDRKFAEFRAWADDIGGTFEDIPAGAFKESGTGVSSVLFVAIKAEG